MHDAYLLPGPLALSRSTVDHASHRRTDDAWLDAAWHDDTTRVLVVGSGIVPVDDGDLRFVSPGDAPDGDRFLLGVQDGVVYFAVPGSGEPADGATLREVGAVLGDRDAGLAVHAVALANWHAAHRHCALCGERTEVAAAGHIRRCPADGSEHYPRTDPAVIVLVTDEHDRCLLGRGTKWPPGRFSTLAGFVEPGETPEHAVAREVYEEAGITVDAARYAGAQPWPFPSSLMLGYYGTAAGADPQPDGDEIAEARWFSRIELTDAVVAGEILLPGGISIARRLVEGWYGGALPTAQ